MKRILIVEDELIVAGDLRRVLEQAGYEVSGVVRTVPKALASLATAPPDLVLVDIFLQGPQTGIDLARQLNQRSIPFVYVSANSNQQVLEAANATQPYGFIVKPFREKDLLIALDIAWYRAAQQQAPQPTAPAPVQPDWSEQIGPGPAMRRVFELMRQVAPMDTSVLILGESGTGKEGVANGIHRLSARRGHPLVKVNCAALPAQLMESELFGHEKGAFTDAHERKTGKFELANGGTLVLDEIGELSLELQPKLLRVLQEKEIERVGGSAPIKLDVRIIAITNRHLEKEIAEGRFRLDLYYRLHVFPILLPPLRERPEDIPALAAHFVAHFAGKYGKPITSIAEPALAKLRSYNWPGNVRELQNVVERSVLLTEGSTMQQLLLPVPLLPTVAPPNANLKTLGEMEREHILAALKLAGNKLSGPDGAASRLQVSEATLRAKMKRLGIVRRYIAS